MRSLLIYLLSLLQIVLYPNLLFADEAELLSTLISKLEAVAEWGSVGVKKPEKIKEWDFEYEKSADQDFALIIEKIGSIRKRWRDESFLFPEPFSETGPTVSEWNDSVSFFINNLKNNDTEIRLLSLRALREISRIEQRRAVLRFDGKTPSTRYLSEGILVSIQREIFRGRDSGRHPGGSRDLPLDPDFRRDDTDEWSTIFNEGEDLIYELKDFYKGLSPYDGDFDGMDDIGFLLFEDYDDCNVAGEISSANNLSDWRQALAAAIRLTECKDRTQRGIGYGAIGELAGGENIFRLIPALEKRYRRDGRAYEVWLESEFRDDSGDVSYPMLLLHAARVALRLGMLREKYLFQILSHEALPYDSDINKFINRIDNESLRQIQIGLFQKAVATYKRIFPLDYDFSGSSLDANDIDIEISRHHNEINTEIKIAAQKAIEELRNGDALILSDSVISWGKEKKERLDHFPRDYEKREIYRIAHREYVDEVLNRDIGPPPNLDKYIRKLEAANNSLQEILNRAGEYRAEEIIGLIEGFFGPLYEHISALLGREPLLSTIVISKIYRFLFLSIEHLPDEIKYILEDNERLFIEDNTITLSPSNLLKLEIDGIRNKIDLKRLEQLNRRIRFLENRGAVDEALTPLFKEADEIGREFLITNGQIYFLKNLTLNWALLQSLTGRPGKLYYPGGDRIAFWLEPTLLEFQAKAKTEWNNRDINEISSERKKFMGELLIASRDLKSIADKLNDAGEQDASYLRSVKNELLFKYPLLSTVVGHKDGEEFDTIDVKTPLISTYKEPLFLWEKIAAESAMEEALTYSYRDEAADKPDKWLPLLDRALGLQEEGMRAAAMLVSIGIDRESTVAALPFQRIVNRDDQFREYQIINTRILEYVSGIESAPLFLDRVVGISSWVFLGAMLLCPAFTPVWLMGAFLLDVADYESTNKKGDLYQKEYLRFISNVTGSEIEIGDLNKFEAARDGYLNADWWFRLGVELNIAVPVGSTLFRGARRFLFIKRQ